MVIVTGLEKLLSVEARGRLGKPFKLGMCQFGHANFGDSQILFLVPEFGFVNYGRFDLGAKFVFSGIYQKYNFAGKKYTLRKDYYLCKNYRYTNQQANRSKMANAVLAWQNLTSEQKAFYNKNKRRRNLCGYNFFLKEYLLSN